MQYGIYFSSYFCFQILHEREARVQYENKNNEKNISHIARRFHAIISLSYGISLCYGFFVLTSGGRLVYLTSDTSPMSSQCNNFLIHIEFRKICDISTSYKPIRLQIFSHHAITVGNVPNHTRSSVRSLYLEASLLLLGA